MRKVFLEYVVVVNPGVESLVDDVQHLAQLHFLVKIHIIERQICILQTCMNRTFKEYLEFVRENTV